MADWHVFPCSSVSRLGEQPLQGDDVLVCALRGSGVLRAAIADGRRDSEDINGETFARALVMLELLQVRDIQSKVLIVGGDPVLLHFRLDESL